MIALEAIAALYELHSPNAVSTDGVTLHICHGCGENHPCHTRRILDEVTT